MLSRTISLLPSLILTLLSTATITSADCECGYALTIDNPLSRERHVFTDLTESNFVRLQQQRAGEGEVRRNTDWAPQVFNLSAERARGDYGEMFAARNVDMIGGKGGSDDPGGLRLTVGKELVQNMVPTAEVASRRLDMMWGTFRTSLKLTDVSGTCAAF